VFEKKADPVIVISIVQELVHRSGIRISLKNRDENTLKPILTFISRNVTKPNYAPILTTLFNIVLGIYSTQVIVDMYGNLLQHSPEMVLIIKQIKNRVSEEISLMRNFNTALGYLDTIFAHSTSSSQTLLKVIEDGK
jgi:U3 small nucleolar RNA-associated protein 15